MHNRINKLVLFEFSNGRKSHKELWQCQTCKEFISDCISFEVRIAKGRGIGEVAIVCECYNC